MKNSQRNKLSEEVNMNVSSIINDIVESHGEDAEEVEDKYSKIFTDALLESKVSLDCIQEGVYRVYEVMVSENLSDEARNDIFKFVITYMKSRKTLYNKVYHTETHKRILDMYDDIVLNTRILNILWDDLEEHIFSPHHIGIMTPYYHPSTVVSTGEINMVELDRIASSIPVEASQAYSFISDFSDKVKVGYGIDIGDVPRSLKKFIGKVVSDNEVVDIIRIIDGIGLQKNTKSVNKLKLGIDRRIAYETYFKLLFSSIRDLYMCSDEAKKDKLVDLLQSHSIIFNIYLDKEGDNFISFKNYIS